MLCLFEFLHIIDFFKEELDRAKKQLQSLLMYNLETSSMVFEDVGRQVLSKGFRNPAQYYLEEIGQLTMYMYHKWRIFGMSRIRCSEIVYDTIY